MTRRHFSLSKSNYPLISHLYKWLLPIFCPTFAHSSLLHSRRSRWWHYVKSLLGVKYRSTRQSCFHRLRYWGSQWRSPPQFSPSSELPALHLFLKPPLSIQDYQSVRVGVSGCCRSHRLQPVDAPLSTESYPGRSDEDPDSKRLYHDWSHRSCGPHRGRASRAWLLLRCLERCLDHHQALRRYWTADGAKNLVPDMTCNW